MYSKKLQRQIRKTLGGEDILQRLKTNPDDPEVIRQIATGLESFCDSVNEAYTEQENLLEVAQRNLDISSKELHTVNQSLVKFNQTFDAMVNSMGQGFLLFGTDGLCLPVYSRACLQLLETDPNGKHIADVLGVPEKRESLTDWYQMLFEDRMDFEDLAAVGPKLFAHSEKRHIALEFKPVRDSGNQITSILMIATDRTDEISAKIKADRTQSYANLVLFILRDRGQFKRMFESARELVEQSAKVVTSTSRSKDDLDVAQKNLHTLKAVAGTIHAAEVHELVQSFEMRILDEHDTQIKWALLTEALMKIHSSLGELTLQLSDLLGEMSGTTREIPAHRLNEFAQLLASKNFNNEQLLQAFRDKILATPIEDIFQQFDEVLSQTASRLNKRVGPIEIVGDRLSIQRETFAPVWASLTNIFRNIVDHGIEEPSVRLQKGKDECGKVKVEFKKEKGRSAPMLEIRIQDDGAGVNVSQIKEKLVLQGRQEFAQKATREELINVIFEKGVSTASKITDISGMGIGLFAVKDAIQGCGGAVSVESQDDAGTVFVLRLPLAS